jgi:hypothetical protein
MVARGTLVHIGCGLAVIEDGAGDKKKTFTLGDFGFDVYYSKSACVFSLPSYRRY